MKIKLRLGSGYNSEHTIENISDKLKYDDTTLKDVAIILKYMCGKGTTQTLAREISYAVSVPYVIVLSALEKIIDAYVNMNDRHAKTKTIGHPQRKMFTETYPK